MRLALLALLVATPVAAEPESYATLLREGRRLEAAGTHAEAEAVFDRLVALAPADPTANAELGWAAFQAGDVEKADAATRKALAGTQTSAARAATLYNLAQIQIRRGGDDPVPLYVESLTLRPDETVRDALHDIAPQTAEAFDPFSTRPLAGPFRTVAASCADHAPTGMTCTCAPAQRTKPADYVPVVHHTGKPALAAPYQQVAVVTRSCRGAEGGKEMFVDLAVQLASGWYVASIDGVVPNAHGGVRAHVEKIEAKDVVPGGDAELVVEYSKGGNYSHRASDTEWSARALVVLGIGASKRPAVTRPIVVAQSGNRVDGWGEDSIPVHRTLTWQPDGTLRVELEPRPPTHRGAPQLDTPRAKLFLDLEARLAGDHAIAFP